MPIRVLIVDDHFITRKGTLALLADAADIEVVGEAANGREAVEQADRFQPDVILMDLIMPEMGGVEATRQILKRQDGTAVLVLTGSDIEKEILAAIREGALGYLSKDAHEEECVQAIRQVHRGEPSLPPEITRKLLKHPSPAPLSPAAEELTRREEEVLRLIARGLANAQIGAKLFISEPTVRTHVHHIREKLGLSNRVEIVHYALREDLMSLEEVLGPAGS